MKISAVSAPLYNGINRQGKAVQNKLNHGAIQQTTDTIAFNGLFVKTPIEKSIAKLGLGDFVKRKLIRAIHNVAAIVDDGMDYIGAITIPANVSKKNHDLQESAKAFVYKNNKTVKNLFKGYIPNQSQSAVLCESSKDLVSCLKDFVDEKAGLHPNDAKMQAFKEATDRFSKVANKVIEQKGMEEDDVINLGGVLKRISSSYTYKDPSSHDKVDTTINDIVRLILRYQESETFTLENADIRNLAKSFQRLFSIEEIKLAIFELKNLK